MKKNNLFSNKDLTPDQLKNAHEIKLILLDLAEFYGATLTEKQYDMWSNVLSSYGPLEIRDSCRTIVKKKDQKFMPRPGEIIDNISKIRIVPDSELKNYSLTYGGFDSSNDKPISLSKEESQKRIQEIKNRISETTNDAS